MAVIRPFKALRPDPKTAEKVASVPYDVVNRDEAAELVKDNPINFLRVTRSEVELDPGVDAYSPEVYEKARKNLFRLVDEAPLIRDEKKSFYVYRQIMLDQVQAGIAATFSVDDYDNDVILKHEKTRKVKEDDRTSHIVTTEAHTGAVFLTYRGVEEVNAVMETTMRAEEPLYDFESEDGVRHTVWRISNDYKDIIQFEIEKVDKLYIADGHHRAASASRAQKVKKEQLGGEHSDDAEYNYFMAVLFPAEQLSIMPYNRVVFDLKMSETEFIEKLKENFEVTETESPVPPERRTMCLFIKGKWYLMRPNENVKEDPESVGNNLDVSILQNYVLHPLLGIEDPRTSNNVDFIGGIRGTDELEKLVMTGKAKAAFSMFPVTVEDLMNISDAGEIMPPKSTWFEPKLRDGLLIHTL